jgi:hypothetical protein
VADTPRTRRELLRAAGAGLLVPSLGAGERRARSHGGSHGESDSSHGGDGPHGGSGGAHGDGSHGRREWTTADSGTSRTLHDVAHAAGGAVAVGSGGVAVERGADGWTVAVESGPSGNGSNLHGVASTDDGERLWLAGASGAMGEYDPGTGALTDRSAPGGVTDTITDVAATGSAGDATVYLADASGRVHVSRENGRDGTWTSHTPGSGASVAAIDVGESRGMLVDGNGDVFETTDGRTWTAVAGPDADASLTAVALDGAGTAVVATDGGAVIAGSADRWEHETPVERPLRDVEVGNCGCVHAVGASGTVVHRMGHGTPGITALARWFDWWRTRTPTGQNLHAIAIGHPHVAVGAAGTIVER